MSTYDELVDACEDFMLTKHARFTGRNILNNNPDIDINYFNTATFWYVCIYGYLEFAKRLFTIKKIINISFDTDERFIITCQWSLSGACYNGQFAVVKWLVEIIPTLNISAYDDEAFRLACSGGHLEIAKWLLALKPTINISAIDEEAFLSACIIGNLELAKWLLDINPTINISIKNDSAFLTACFSFQINIVEWLVSINSNYSISIDDNPSTERHKKISYKIQNPDIVTLLPPPYTITAVDDDELVCCICKENDIHVRTNCIHHFGKSCLTQWYKQQKTCPMCRQELSYYDNIINIST